MFGRRSSSGSGLRAVTTIPVPRWSGWTSRAGLQQARPWLLGWGQRLRRAHAGDAAAVEIGRASVKPGDLIVADGDGAIVVPGGMIDDVLYYAKQESENDRYDRGMLFEVLGIAPDESTRPMFPEMPPHPYKKKREDFMKRLGR